MLKDATGGYFLLGRRGGPDDMGAYVAAPDEAATPGMRGSYTDVFRVDVTEHVDTRAVGIPTVYGTESVDLWVSWWVHDPVRVVRTDTLHGWHVILTHLTSALRLSPPRTDWQEELASLLGRLSDQERKEISCVLRDRISALGRQVPGVAI
ncbi:hypothetical protein [Streptomyces telluris]|uniref:Uncharacterized protein n=1 Tax=Streptomyces telluris TaxID=2720021 RepID=A0A9X2LL28_9ACTN|nr:hypothetical protein [Streptomyces telluris]MCQ8773314.1 hypothetical protein [Streptomyces telluris]